MSKSDLRMDWCSYTAAKSAITRWYYRDEMPLGKLVKIGVWEQDIFSGVVIFGLSASDALGRRWGLGTFECCELSRLALRPDHRTPVSRVVKVAVSMLRKQSPGVRAIVSFADSRLHHGGVYQAGGWLYTGTTSADRQYRDVNGRIWHSREVSKTGYKATMGRLTRTVRPQDCEIICVPGKHRYVMPLDEEIRGRVVTRGLVDPPRPNHSPEA